MARKFATLIESDLKSESQPLPSNVRQFNALII